MDEHCKKYIINALQGFGYEITEENCWGPWEGDLNKISAQYRLRQEDQKPKNMYEVEIALCEAICLNGGYVVYPGDGTGCAAQMYWAQFQRAEKLETRVKELENEIERLKNGK